VFDPNGPQCPPGSQTDPCDPQKATVSLSWNGYFHNQDLFSSPAPLGVYTAVLTLTDLSQGVDPAAPHTQLTVSWTVQLATRLVAGGTRTIRLGVSPDEVQTTGSCLAVRSTQVEGARIQCFGDPGSRAILTVVLEAAELNSPKSGTVTPTKLIGPIHVRGKGEYDSVSARIEGTNIIVTVSFSGKMQADLMSVLRTNFGSEGRARPHEKRRRYVVDFGASLQAFLIRSSSVNGSSLLACVARVWTGVWTRKRVTPATPDPASLSQVGSTKRVGCAGRNRTCAPVARQ
jgi:hypothetical protein